MSTKLTITSIAALAALGFAAAVQAAPAGGPSSDPNQSSVKVSLTGLDLQSEAGAKIALHRIRSAATDVCGVETDARLIVNGDRNPSCTADAVDRAVAALGNPIVTTLYAGPGQSAALASRGH